MDLDVKAKTINLSEENSVEYVFDSGVRKYFLGHKGQKQ